MFPVSGAAQFTASDAICPPRPRISAITAYCHVCQLSFISEERKITCFKVRQRNTVFGIVCFAEEEVPEPKFARFYLQFLDHRHNRLPTLYRVLRDLGMSKLGRGENLVLGNTLNGWRAYYRRYITWTKATSLASISFP